MSDEERASLLSIWLVQAGVCDVKQMWLLEKKLIWLQQDAKEDKQQRHSRQFAQAVGGRLRSYREMRKLTRAKLADLSGVSISAIESGEHGHCHMMLSTLFCLADALRVSPSILVAEIDEVEL